MSKANEKTFEKYPVSIDETWKDCNKRPRTAYIEGYHQVEKDLELTWEDVRLLDLLCCKVDTSCELEEKEHYQEVLKRFKEQRT